MSVSRVEWSFENFNLEKLKASRIYIFLRLVSWRCKFFMLVVLECFINTFWQFIRPFQMIYFDIYFDLLISWLLQICLSFVEGREISRQELVVLVTMSEKCEFSVKHERLVNIVLWRNIFLRVKVNRLITLILNDCLFCR